MRTAPKNKKIDYDELPALWKNGWTNTQIAKRYGVDEIYLQKVRLRLGIKGKRSQKKVDWQEARRLRVEEHWSYRRIADKYGCNYDNVKKRLKHPIPKLVKNVCECGRRKTSSSKTCAICRRSFDVDLALYLYSLGFSRVFISSALGVKPLKIIRLIKRRMLSRTLSCGKLASNSVRRELTIEEAIETYFRAVTDKKTPPTLDEIKQARESQKLARIRLISEFSQLAIDTSSDTCNTSDM